MSYEQRFDGPQLPEVNAGEPAAEEHKIPKASVGVSPENFGALKGAAGEITIPSPDIPLQAGDLLVAVDGTGSSVECEIVSLDAQSGKITVKYTKEPAGA